MSRTTDLQLYEDDLRNQTDQIRELVNSLDKVGGDARAAKVQKAQQLIKTAMSNLHHFKVALRSSNDPDAPRLERRHAEITQQLTQLKEKHKPNAPAAAAVAEVDRRLLPRASRGR